MNKQLIVHILVLATLTFTAQAQSGSTKTSKPKSARGTTSTTVVIDSASNAGATNDGASGQSGRPMAIPSSTTAQASSVKSQERATRKVKRSSRSNQR
ncbi:hypothetical protein [Spirosoma fluviale]|uniref:Uncharacterized protein n=1 Tax=Spirosoma fluviale TaxID=1597977 RepID=A0A286G065_9BACT|nr:hypothetical protein [Spirosoma fluviale]SOD88921.1 hypothetical protein SAMN06269250_2888 [Spirosoma fluviale]